MSDTPDTTAPETAADAPRPSPGALLRQARERAGLGPDDLAAQLKLAKGTLEALERDDFAALSEPVYVRGYYRKIAKLLPVSEAELIAAYNARSKPARSAPALQRIPLAGGVAAGTSRQYKGQGIAIAVVVAILIGVLIAIADRQPTPRLAEAPPAPAPATDAPADAFAESVTPPPAAELAVPVPAPVTPPMPEPRASSVRPGAGTIAESAPAAAAPTTAPSVPATTKAVPGPAPAPAAPADALALEFSDASFVRVEDSRGRTLAIGLVKAGEKPVLTGRPPYTVFLGNAQSVRVFYNGQPVNFAAHVNQQNDTARFTVP